MRTELKEKISYLLITDDTDDLKRDILEIIEKSEQELRDRIINAIKQ